MKLTHEQEQVLAQITEAKQREDVLVKQFEAALQAQLKAFKESEGYKETYSLMRQAYALGVPKRQIGFAYGTKDPGTVNRILTPASAYNTTSTTTPTSVPTPTHVPPTTPTPTEDSVEVTLLTPESEDYPEFLTARENPGRAAKIRATFQNPTPCGKIGGLEAVVWLDHKIAITDAPTPLTDLIDGPREEWPAALEEALAPYLNS